MLPPLTHLKLKERQEERAKRERCGGAAATTQQLKQEQRQQHHRRQREQEERAQLAKQAELEGRRIPELRARAAKVGGGGARAKWWKPGSVCGVLPRQ